MSQRSSGVGGGGGGSSAPPSGDKKLVVPLAKLSTAPTGRGYRPRVSVPPKCAYRVNSWSSSGGTTSHHNKSPHIPPPPGGGSGGSNGGGVVVSNKSFSMTSFHPPLCVYTPTPGTFNCGWSSSSTSSGPKKGGGGGGAPYGGHFSSSSTPLAVPIYFNNSPTAQPSPAPPTILPDIPIRPLVAAAENGSCSTSAATIVPASAPSKEESDSESVQVKNPETKLPPPSEQQQPLKLSPLPAPPVYRMMKDVSITHILCAVCCKKNGRLCTGCRHVAYCSEKCQRAHWPLHKFDCDPPTMMEKALALVTMKKQREGERGSEDAEDTGVESEPEEEEEEGAEMVEVIEGAAYTGKILTRRRCKATELVASSTPIMTTGCNTMVTPNPPDSVICLNCTRWYQASLGYRCSTCRWPVCSLECEKSFLHSNFECKVFYAAKRLPPPLKDHSQFYNDAVLAIRCLLLKEVDPPKYQELAELMEIYGARGKKEEFLVEDRKIIKYLKNECLIDDWVEMGVEELLDFLTVIDACSVVVQDRIFIQVTEAGKSYYAPKFVFPMKLYVSQGCIPNCKWSIKHSPKIEECSLRVHAAVDIPSLSYITACFSSDRHVIGSWFQPDLSGSKFHGRCTCPRCKDPTEAGSYFSGILCEICNSASSSSWGRGDVGGVLLPTFPLSRDSPWACNSATCTASLDGETVRKKILGFHDEIFKSNTHEDFYALVQLKWKLEQWLHPNHFLLLKIAVMCVMLFWGSVRGLPFFSPRYDYFISTINLAQEALRIYDIICPGASIQRARVLFQLQVAYAYKHLREIRRHMEWGGDLEKYKHSPSPGYPISFWELMRIQEEALSALKTEPYGTMEHEMAAVLLEVIEDQRDLLCSTPREVNLDITSVYNLHKIYTRFSNQYYYPAIPIYEDKDIHEFLVVTGPCARHVVEKLNFPI